MDSIIAVSKNQNGCWPWSAQPHVNISFDWMRQYIRRKDECLKWHADKILLEDRTAELPGRITQIISTLGGIIFQRGTMIFNQFPDVPSNRAGTATKGCPSSPSIVASFGKTAGVGIVFFFASAMNFNFRNNCSLFLSTTCLLIAMTKNEYNSIYFSIQ